MRERERPGAATEQESEGTGPVVGKRTLTDKMMRKAAGPAPAAETPEVRAALQAGGGAALSQAVRGPVERVTGGDLSGARVHQGAQAEAASAALGARAFTFGSDIYLGAGESPGDHRLMAHEAAHVLQQGALPQRKALGVLAESDPAEAEADHVAEAAFGAGERARTTLVAPRSGGYIARIPLNQVTTPERAPAATPDTIPAPAGEVLHDNEGNTIRRAGGHMYISEDPGPRLTFPHRPGNFRLYPINPNAAYAGLLAECRAVRAQQAAVSARLRGRDMKYWFARVYEFVTTVELEHVAAGAYQYPHMKMQEVIAFNHTYQANLTAWESGQRAQVESNWRAAFATAESENNGSYLRNRTFEILHALLPSIQAHIRFDLPRAIAACYQTHYAGIPTGSLNDFRPDFDAMTPVFTEAQNRLRPEIGAQTWFSGNSTLQGMGNAVFGIDVVDERNLTWERTQAIVHAQNTGTNSQATVVAAVEGGHPMRGGHDFDVDGTRVNDYNWDRQPNMRPDAPGPTPTYQPAPPPPAFPARLYFRQARPNGSERLEAVIRDDQDLAPYRDLAQWTTRVRGARVAIDGHASIEGPPAVNHNLSWARADLLAFFMLNFGYDQQINPLVLRGLGVEGTQPDPQHRYVEIRVDTSAATSRQQATPNNRNLPSEVRP